LKLKKFRAEVSYPIWHHGKYDVLAVDDNEAEAIAYGELLDDMDQASWTHTEDGDLVIDGISEIEESPLEKLTREALDLPEKDRLWLIKKLNIGL
jgi:hypothetical protein